MLTRALAREGKCLHGGSRRTVTGVEGEKTRSPATQRSVTIAESEAFDWGGVSNKSRLRMDASGPSGKGSKKTKGGRG